MNCVRGNLAELIFQAEALKRGLVPHFPFGNYLPHDVALFNPSSSKFFRVQVKATETGDMKRPRVHWSIAKGNKVKTSYHGGEIDFLALHRFDTAEWFIVPVDIIAGRKTISITDGNDALEKYREAWEQFHT